MKENKTILAINDDSKVYKYASEIPSVTYKYQFKADDGTYIYTLSINLSLPNVGVADSPSGTNARGPRTLYNLVTAWAMATVIDACEIGEEDDSDLLPWLVTKGDLELYNCRLKSPTTSGKSYSSSQCVAYSDIEAIPGPVVLTGKHIYSGSGSGGGSPYVIVNSEGDIWIGPFPNTSGDVTILVNTTATGHVEYYSTGAAGTPTINNFSGTLYFHPTDAKGSDSQHGAKPECSFNNSDKKNVTFTMNLAGAAYVRVTSKSDDVYVSYSESYSSSDILSAAVTNSITITQNV